MRKKCGKELQYRINRVYANDQSRKQNRFAVTRTVRLGKGLADDENYNPFLLVLREIETAKEQILHTFWAYGQGNTQRGGQFPPLLSLEEWKMLFRLLTRFSHVSDIRCFRCTSRSLPLRTAAGGKNSDPHPASLF